MNKTIVEAISPPSSPFFKGGKRGIAVVASIFLVILSAPVFLPAQEMIAGSDASVTTTAAALAGASTPAYRGVVVQADPDNTADVFIGTASSQPIQLTPGQAATLDVDNVDKIYRKSASGTQVINWLGFK